MGNPPDLGFQIPQYFIRLILMTNKGERKGMERVREGNNYTLGKDLVGHHITENQETVITQQMLLYSFKIRTC